MKFKTHYEKWLITRRDYLKHLENELKEHGEEGPDAPAIKAEISRVSRHHLHTRNRKQ